MSDNIRVKSLSHLKKLCKDRESREFRMALTGCFSRKIIGYDPTDIKPWSITNCIDESEQFLTDEEIMDKSFSNIGNAIKNGHFYVEE